MFRKTFKIKSNTQIKASERKLLKDKLLKSFSTLTENDVEIIMPKKENVNMLKIITASQDTVVVYTVQKRPFVFEHNGVFYPTLYLLWKYPNLLLCFTIHQNVMNYIISGADLMLPGITNALSSIGNFTENTPAYVNLITNKAAVIVGVTAQSSEAMIAANGKGKCIKVYHYYGDKLCTLDGLQALPLPEMGSSIATKNYNDDFPPLGEKPSTSATTNNEPQPDVTGVAEKTEDSQEMSVEDMDALLMHCFLASLKYSKTITLPILTSNFYKLQMTAFCPQNKKLDIKKSSYKKFGTFIDAMVKMEIITVEEPKKGVQAINKINKDHPKLNEFFIPKDERPSNPEGDQTPKTSVDHGYIITQAVVPIFAEFNLNKGDTVQASDVRKYITEYVKKNNLQDDTNKSLVHIKDKLTAVCKTEGLISWEELIEKVCDSMKSCYKVSSSGAEIVNKGKIVPITITVANRAGNKKVTLVDNMDSFGISVPDFAKECQHGAAASTSISRPPDKKSDQLLIQGNQVLFVYNLLVDKYKIPKAYIRGLENAPKKKKK